MHFGWHAIWHTVEKVLIIEDAMFRIKKVFENDLIIIWKIEGEISNDRFQFWIDEMNRLITHVKKQIIFDMCDVACIAAAPAQRLIDILTKDVYLLNCPTFVKNMLQSAGLSSQVMDA